MSFKKPFRAVPLRSVAPNMPQPKWAKLSPFLLGAIGLGIGGALGSVLIERPTPTVSQTPVVQSVAHGDRATFIATPSMPAEPTRVARPFVPAPEPEREEMQAAQASGAWSYRNCRAARAAGAAPIYVGQPGYGGHLDADGDGIACEPYRGR